MTPEREAELVMDVIFSVIKQIDFEYGLRMGGRGPDRDFSIEVEGEESSFEIFTSEGSKYKLVLVRI